MSEPRKRLTIPDLAVKKAAGERLVTVSFQYLRMGAFISPLMLLSSAMKRIKGTQTCRCGGPRSCPLGLSFTVSQYSFPVASNAFERS